ELMKITGERDGFLTRDITYFESMYDALNPNGHMELFLVELHGKEVRENLENDINKVQKDIKKAEKNKDETKRANLLENLNNRLEKLNQQMEETKYIEEKYPEGVVLSGALYAQSGKKAYYLYGASSNDFRDFLPNHHMQFHMMQYAREHGATTYDFGGVSVSPDKDSEYFGLWQFKSQWGRKVSNKIGEFDFILNRPVYHLLNIAIPAAQKTKIALNRLRKK